MRKHLLSIASACVLATSAGATTFPSLTTIYVIPGVKDSGDGANNGVATTIQCSNVSGVATTIRFLVLSSGGAVLESVTNNNFGHGTTFTRSTHSTAAYLSEGILIPGTQLTAGVINIESLQSGVFCTAAIIDASAVVPDGIPLHIIRTNPHPGSVE
jgi:hypothetical protein